MTTQAEINSVVDDIAAAQSLVSEMAVTTATTAITAALATAAAQAKLLTPTPVPTPTPSVLGTPTGLSASVSGTTVTLAWANGPGTTGVYVYQDGSKITGPSGVATSLAITGVTAGTHAYYVIDYNTVGNSTKSSTVNVTVSVLTMAAIANQNWTKGTAITAVTPVATGGVTPLVWAINPALPAGLSFSTSTGEISGTPTVSLVATSYTITVTDATATNASKAFTVTVAAPPVVTTVTLAPITAQSVTVDVAFSGLTLAATGGATPYTFTQTGLPTGLSLNASTGAITGTPTTVETVTVTATVTDSTTPVHETSSSTFTFTVRAVSSFVPIVPSGMSVPTTMVFDDEFTGTALKAPWQPRWFGDGATSQGTIMRETNVSVGAGGLALALASNSTGGIISSNPQDYNNLAAGVGFQIAPTAGKPVYIEFSANLPASSGGKVANWPALWATGQTWPEDGEIDVLEGLDGQIACHTHWGSGSADLGGEGDYVSTVPGAHILGVLWSTTECVFVYDGVIVWTHVFGAGAETTAMAYPKFLVLENALPYTSGNNLLVPSVVTVRYVRVWQNA